MPYIDIYFTGFVYVVELYLIQEHMFIFKNFLKF